MNKKKIIQFGPGRECITTGSLPFSLRTERFIKGVKLQDCIAGGRDHITAVNAGYSILPKDGLVILRQGLNLLAKKEG